MHFLTRTRILFIGFTFIISVLTWFTYLRVDQTGLLCSYYYDEAAKGPPVYTGRPRAVDVGLGKPLDLGPSPRFPLTFRFEGFFNLPKPGERYELSIVSNVPVKMTLGEKSFHFPSLKTWDKPKEWGVTAFPLGRPYRAIDNIQETRWDTGRPKQSGDWFALDFGKEEKIIGLVLDSAGSSDRDCPTDFRVDAAVIKGADQKVARIRVPNKRALAVDTWFEPVQARYLRVTQTEEDPVFYWSIHELYMISEAFLDQRAIRIHLSDLESLKIEGSFIAGPSGLGEDYQLVQLFWKPPGKNWERVPQWALRPDTVNGLGPWEAQAVKVLRTFLPWIWAVLAGFWAAMYIPRQKTHLS